MSAVVGRCNAFVVLEGNWLSVRNNTHAIFATAVDIHSSKAAANAGPSRSSSSSAERAHMAAVAPAGDVAA